MPLAYGDDRELYSAAAADVTHCRALYLTAVSLVIQHPDSDLARDALDGARRALTQALCIREMARGDDQATGDRRQAPEEDGR